MGSDNLPAVDEGDALACTGDLESLFLIESVGDLPMVGEFSSRGGGGQEGGDSLEPVVAYTQ